MRHRGSQNNMNPVPEQTEHLRPNLNAMAEDEFVKAEALTALLGVTVKQQSEVSDSDEAVKLDVKDLPMMALLGEDTRKKENTSCSLGEVLYVIPDEFFDPKYDFDFTHKSDSDSDCTRGKEPYARPYGWKRFALKVRDKYPDGNAWLGTAGWRKNSAPGEWPVSYHGTVLEGAEGIVKTHYKAGEAKVYGRGIYSTPNIKVADRYARRKQFTSKINRKTYEVIMQNRINPEKREITNTQDYWLVSIPEGTSAEEEKEIVESSIRPYGILLKEVLKDD